MTAHDRSFPVPARVWNGTALLRPRDAAVGLFVPKPTRDRYSLAVEDEVFHADYVEDDPPPGMGPGREALREWLAGWITAFPDARWALEEQIADKDRVWSRSTWQGTHQGPFLGIPPTGKKVTVAAWTIDRFADGKIAESRIVLDTPGIMQQLGVIPASA